jgi:hypothetical protein
VNLNLAKPQHIAIVFSSQDLVEMQMIVQDEDQPGALEFVRRLRRRVQEIERRHCGDPDRLPGLD